MVEIQRPCLVCLVVIW